MPEPLADALAAVRSLVTDEPRLVRAIASGRRKGEQPTWRRIELRPVDLASGRVLQVTCYDDRQAHTRNDQGDAALASIDALLAEPFGNWHVETLDETLQLRVTKKGDAQVHRSGPPTAVDLEAERTHDRAKPRLLDPAEPFLLELGLTDGNGRIKPSRLDKFRQVEEMLRALDVVLPGAGDPHSDPLRVVDLGCGNGYLTFATYAHLTARGGRSVTITGVDVKAQAREHGDEVAERLGWSGAVRFVEGSAAGTDLVEEHDGAPDVVLALHACDTATDEALARAVRWGSRVILAAPCCHHDLQRQLAAAGHAAAPQPYGALTRHGILRERFTDVLTDAVRASVLRLLGYRVEVVEFIGSEHTPRNTLIRAVRTGAPPTVEQVQEYVDLVAAWDVQPRLQQLLAVELAPLLADAAP